jgi:hypothetical protein
VGAGLVEDPLPIGAGKVFGLSVDVANGGPQVPDTPVAGRTWHV